MAKRKKIGLFYSYDENWIGGSYYLQNLLMSLNTLPNKEKPYITIFTNTLESFNSLKNICQYPYLSYYSTDTTKTEIELFINKVYYKLFKKTLITKKPKADTVDIVFPAFDSSFFNQIPLSKYLFWCPDFQEKYLPQFFSLESIDSRYQWHQTIANRKVSLVLSSNDAYNDFNKFYPDNITQKFVLPFAVTHPSFKQIDIQTLLEKYNLPKQYFFSPNQFWAHKNHKIIFDALSILKHKGIKYTVVFSGKENDSRNPNFFTELKQYAYNLGLQDQIFFLGFIDRAEQLKLMSEAHAIIQPSLFEGWSTVVEDTKAINQRIILSNLAVHQEQMKENVLFFDPQNAIDLANKLQESIEHPAPIIPLNYEINVKQFGIGFMQIVNTICNNNFN